MYSHGTLACYRMRAEHAPISFSGQGAADHEPNKSNRWEYNEDGRSPFGLFLVVLFFIAICGSSAEHRRGVVVER